MLKAKSVWLIVSSIVVLVALICASSFLFFSFDKSEKSSNTELEIENNNFNDQNSAIDPNDFAKDIGNDKDINASDPVATVSSIGNYTGWTRTDNETFTFYIRANSALVSSVTKASTSGNVDSATCTVYFVSKAARDSYSSCSKYSTSNAPSRLNTLTMVKQSTGSSGSSYYIKFTLTADWSGSSPGNWSATFNLYCNPDWTTTPSISSWTYGGSAKSPSGSRLGCSMTYRYYHYYDDWDYETGYNFSKPSTPGKYVLVAVGSGDLISYKSKSITFYVYAPTPTMSTTTYYKTGSTITASTSYNSSYVNAPSGVTGTNAGSYTATFTTKSMTYTISECDGNDCWDSSYTEQYVFSNGSTSYSISWSIVEKTKVTRPSISPWEFEYTGSRITISDPGGYTNRNASYVNIASNSTTYATEPGKYYIYFTLKDTTTMQWSDGTTGQKSDYWVINQALTPVSKPTASGGTSYQYTGSTITHSVSNYNTTYMTRSGTYQASARGSYTVTYALKSGYCWSDGTTSNVSLSWSIVVRSVTVPTVSGSYTYDGGTKSASISNTSGYYTQTGTSSASAVGTYYVYFNLPNTSDYKWSDGTTGQKSGSWTINKKSVTIPTVSGSYTYDGGTKSASITNTGDSSWYTQGGTSSATNAGTYTVTFNLVDTANTQWSGGSTSQQSGTWTINKASLTIPTINKNPTFSGSSVSPTLNDYNSSLMEQSGDLSAINVKTSGTYTLTISLTTAAKANYKWSDGTDTSKNVTWNVVPLDFSQAGLNITIPQTDFVFDGTSKMPEPTVTI